MVLYENELTKEQVRDYELDPLGKGTRRDALTQPEGGTSWKDTIKEPS